MLKAWLKKVFYFISTIWVLSMLCFALSKMTPDDPVLTQLGLPVEDLSPGNPNFKVFEKRYSDLVEQAGYQLPYFYFGISSIAGMPGLSDELYLPRKYYIQKLNAQTGNPDFVMSFLDAKSKYLEETKNDLPVHLRNALDTTTIPGKINSISIQIQSDPQFHSSAHFEELNSSIKQLMEPKSIKSRIPILKWNGFENQYHQWITKILKGDWGNSYRDNRPVWQKIWPAFKWTISLNFIAILLIIVLSVRWAFYTAVRPQSGLSHFSYTILFVIASFPVFLISIVALLIFTGNGMFGLFPTPGAFPVLSQGVFWRELGTVLPFILLPLILIVLAGLPSLTRQVHNIMVMELQKEYVQAAILRGIPIKKIVNQYAWKNALGVLSVYLGRLIPALISGSIVIESIFNLPGMGSLLIGSVISRDWPVVFGIVFLGGSFTVLGLMFADLVLYRVDPNILKSGKIQAS